MHYTDKKHFILFLSFIIAWLSVAVYMLDIRPALYDEFGTIWIASQPQVDDILKKVKETDVHPPTHYLFLHFWGTFFGYSDVAMRLPSLLFILLSIPLITRLIPLLVSIKSKKEIYFTAALCLTTPVIWAMGITTRYYTLCMFWGLLSTFVYLKWFERKTAGWLIGNVLAIAGSFYIHYLLCVCLLIGEGLHFLAHYKEHTKLNGVQWLTSRVFIFILMIPGLCFWLVPLLSTVQGEILPSYREGLVGVLAIPFLLIGNFMTLLNGAVLYPWDFWINGPLFIIAAFLILSHFFGSKSVIFNKRVIALFVIPFALVITVSVIKLDANFFRGIMRVSYLPVFAWIILGRGLFSISTVRKRYLTLFLIILCNGYCAWVLFMNKSSITQVHPVKEMVNYIEEKTPPAISPFIIHPFIHGWGDALQRYFPRARTIILAPNVKSSALIDFKKMIEEDSLSNVWLIQRTRFYDQYTPLSESLLKQGYMLKEEAFYQKQRKYDLWVKEWLKSLNFLKYEEKRSFPYILSVKRFYKPNILQNN
ncbi:MAG: hypothetical protein GKR87_04840 [Kiritimatiellae bacterium]|nr:hypothetical protein [Kiritimatiellia bacterium]